MNNINGSKYIVEMVDCEKKINHNIILRKVTFRVGAGEICGIIGANGSGKSMLLKAICGLIVPTKGTIKVFGDEIGINGKMANSTGFLIEEPGIINKYSAKMNLSIMNGIKKKPDMQRLITVMNEVGLDPECRKPVRKYSLGMKQKIGIAEAFLDNPSLILLDEPANNLDEPSQINLLNLIRKYNSHGTTFIITGHQLDFLKQICSRILICNKGILTEELHD